MVLSLTLSFLLFSAPAPAEGPKPTVEDVQVDDEGRPYVEVVITQPKQVPYTTLDEQQRPITMFKIIPIHVTMAFYLDTNGVQVYNRAGKKLAPAEVCQVLAKAGKILVSSDGKSIDPRHVARLAEGQVLVVSPSLVNLPREGTFQIGYIRPEQQGF